MAKKLIVVSDDDIIGFDNAHGYSEDSLLKIVGDRKPYKLLGEFYNWKYWHIVEDVKKVGAEVS